MKLPPPSPEAQAFTDALQQDIANEIRSAGGWIGFDRFMMLLSKKDSIRDVIAFPKTQKASCIMTQAPSTVELTQLRELHIRLRESAK